MNTQTNLANIIVIDLDGTLVRGQSQKYFISFLRKKRVVSFFTYLLIISWFVIYKANLVKDVGRALTYVLKSFAGKDEVELQGTIKEFVEKEIEPRYYKNSKKFVSALQEKGYTIILLSSAVEIIVKAIANNLSIPEYLCTRVEVKNGKYTGKLLGMQVYGEHKNLYLEDYLSKINVSLYKIITIADHYSDIHLLEASHMGIVANPDAKMKNWCKQKKFPVVYLDNDESVQYIESYIKSQ